MLWLQQQLLLRNGLGVLLCEGVCAGAGAGGAAVADSDSLLPSRTSSGEVEAAFPRGRCARLAPPTTLDALRPDLGAAKARAAPPMAAQASHGGAEAAGQEKGREGTASVIVPGRRDHGDAMLDRLCRRTHWQTPTWGHHPAAGLAACGRYRAVPEWCHHRPHRRELRPRAESRCGDGGCGMGMGTPGTKVTHPWPSLPCHAVLQHLALSGQAPCGRAMGLCGEE